MPSSMIAPTSQQAFSGSVADRDRGPWTNCGVAWRGRRPRDARWPPNFPRPAVRTPQAGDRVLAVERAPLGKREFSGGLSCFLFSWPSAARRRLPLSQEGIRELISEWMGAEGALRACGQPRSLSPALERKARGAPLSLATGIDLQFSIPTPS